MNTMSKAKKFIAMSVAIALAYPVFVVSVLFFLFLVPGAVLGFVIVLGIEYNKKLPPKSWLKYLCWSWLILAFPTFGLMPFLLTERLHYDLPLGRQLGIFTGISFAEIYGFFIHSPEFDKVDHPSPPLTRWQLLTIGTTTTIISILALSYLSKARSSIKITS